MRLRTVLACVPVLFAVFSIPLFASASVNCGQLSRTLKLGVSGEDVRALQVFLNSDERTKITSTGLGSQGNESTYFGGKTKAAVIKFQELYKNEVLSPAGLTRGSGLVGSLSRAKIASLCGQKNNTNGSQSRTVTPAPTPTISVATPASLLATPVAIENNIKPYLIQPANYAVRQGGKLIIYGGGYSTKNNMVHVGDMSYLATVNAIERTLEVTLPSTATKGKFDLWFSNTKGESRKTFVVITDPNAVPPKVTAFTPKSGYIGTTVSVSGENFSKEWNDIVVGTKTITGIVSPDGKTLSFVATLPVPGVANGEDVANVNVSSPLWFYVVNPSGISGSSVFTLKF